MTPPVIAFVLNLFDFQGKLASEKISDAKYDSIEHKVSHRNIIILHNSKVSYKNNYLPPKVSLLRSKWTSCLIVPFDLLNYKLSKFISHY